MGKNILIFSDGTGQAGGFMPDEARSNVYKLYRATRCGPDTIIDPMLQLTFYDPGLGSKGSGRNIKIGWWRSIYNFLSKATGLGITRNIIDCYAAIIRMWEPGDRIYLFGFSRGAYTVRCVGGVLGLCGVPTRMKDGSPLKRDPASAHMIASEAVKQVYQFGSSVAGDPYKPQRLQKAREFRKTYGSAQGEKANAVPYFIGVWDTVSALGAGWIWLSILTAAGFALTSTIVKLGSPYLPYSPVQPGWLESFLTTLALAGLIYFVVSLRFKQPMNLSKYRMAFYDTKLNPDVPYARHALSIDENRKDFGRVPWQEETYVKTAEGGPERFMQVWFAGNHSDIGGSYPENESRLSDIGLKWMSDEARNLPHPIFVDETYLKLSISSAGPQHDERKATIASMPGWFRWLARRVVSEKHLGWIEKVRDVPRDAPLHPSVLERFDQTSVLAYDETVPYRPEALRNHIKLKRYYV
jgi:uncharacterized protein (DUF2235 family)